MPGWPRGHPPSWKATADAATGKTQKNRACAGGLPAHTMRGLPEALLVDADESLPDIVARLTAGDLSARDSILERCAARIRLLTRRMLRQFPEVRRHDDTDDVFQLAAMRLYRALGEMVRNGDSPRSIMALAATQVRRTLLDLARRNRGPWSHAANHDTNVDRRGCQQVDRATAGDEALDRWEAFHAAVESLPDEEREVVHLAWYMGADQRTIAGMAGCSERTVRNRWMAARKSLKAALDDGPPC